MRMTFLTLLVLVKVIFVLALGFESSQQQVVMAQEPRNPCVVWWHSNQTLAYQLNSMFYHAQRNSYALSYAIAEWAALDVPDCYGEIHWRFYQWAIAQYSMMRMIDFGLNQVVILADDMTESAPCPMYDMACVSQNIDNAFDNVLFNGVQEFWTQTYDMNQEFMMETRRMHCALIGSSCQGEDYILPDAGPIPAIAPTMPAPAPEA